MSIKMIKIGWDASIVIMKWYLGDSRWRNSPSRKLFGSWSAITLSYHLSIWIYTKRNFQIFSMNFRCKLCTLNCVDKIYLETTSPLIFYKKKQAVQKCQEVWRVCQKQSILWLRIFFGEIMDGSLALNSAAGGGSQGLDSLTPLYTWG